MSHPHLLDGFLALVLAMEPGLGEIQVFVMAVMAQPGHKTTHIYITEVFRLLLQNWNRFTETIGSLLTLKNGEHHRLSK